MSLAQILRNAFQKFAGATPRVPSSSSGFLAPSNSWSVDLIRTKTRYHFPRPSEKKRIKKHGWWTRMATLAGRRTLQRRILKGRYVLSH
ncbi:39S ribosomal protein L34, mitochondrial [Sipha flava]|uniref:Large ribosomal subunit protein bL34m n=1 Tax=Sipha flava TaxID=143950 RepID=A0A8B8G0Q7_9HEMI|nr:39S ribosomal protein L34, mitochondrial [Sipha flava]